MSLPSPAAAEPTGFASWPKLPTLSAPPTEESRRTWNGETWEDRYKRQHLILLDAAFEISRKVGYEATQTLEIANLARVSKRTFYEHFASKEDCFAQLMRRASVPMLRALISQAEAAPAGTHADALQSIIETWIGRVNGQQLSTVMLEGQLRHGELQVERENANRLIGQILGVFARKAGSLLSDAELEVASRLVSKGIAGVLTGRSSAEIDRTVEVPALAAAAARALGLT